MLGGIAGCNWYRLGALHDWVRLDFDILCRRLARSPWVEKVSGKDGVHGWEKDCSTYYVSRRVDGGR